MLEGMTRDYATTGEALRLLDLPKAAHWRIWELREQGLLRDPIEESPRRRWWARSDLLAYKFAAAAVGQSPRAPEIVRKIIRTARTSGKCATCTCRKRKVMKKTKKHKAPPLYLAGDGGTRHE